MTRAAIAITGMGAISAFGAGALALVRGAFDGACAIRPIRARFDTSGFAAALGALVPGRDAPVREENLDVVIEYALVAAREAIAQAGANERSFRLAHAALVVGASVGWQDVRASIVGERVASALGIEGPRITVATACTASANAVGIAMDLLRRGDVDVAIAGGADVLTPHLFAGFHALGALGSEPCTPFGLPTGTTIGEGAGFFVLERDDDAVARGARVIAWLRGYGLSSDAYHPTSPDPSGAGVARAIRDALDDADVAPSAIDYVNAHGTGTDANDAAEILGITAALGRADVPTSSCKGSFGHAQAAAGILELIVTAHALSSQRVPPTTGLRVARRGAPRDAIPVARDASMRAAISVNAAFAGANSAVIATSTSRGEARQTSARDVFVASSGATFDARELETAFQEARAPQNSFDVRADTSALARDLPMVDPRGMDPSTKLVALALARAVAKVPALKNKDSRANTAILAATTRSSPATIREFSKSIRERGLPRVSATAFARLVPNAPAGAASRALALRGPLSTIANGRGGALVALALGANMIATRTHTLHAACVAFEEHADNESNFTEGAAALVVGREPSAVRVANFRIFSPTETADSLADAEAGDLVFTDSPHTSRVRTFDFTRAFGNSAVASMFACVVAVDSIRRGDARRVIVASFGGAAGAAIVFEGT